MTKIKGLNVLTFEAHKLNGMVDITFEAHKLNGMVDIMGHGKIERVLRVKINESWLPVRTWPGFVSLAVVVLCTQYKLRRDEHRCQLSWNLALCPLSRITYPIVLDSCLESA